MQLYPTRRTFHVAVAGIGLLTLGASARLSPVVAFGGAMLLAVAFGRAIAQMSIARLRAAGFEMVWAENQRVRRITLGAEVVLRGELRNRGDELARAVRIRPIASSMLETSVTPTTLLLAPHARTFVEVRVRAKRVGRWGVHGLALEVSGVPFGAEGLYEVPLLFANPLGIEVLPRALGPLAHSLEGARARRVAERGRRGRISGGGDELRELREHAPGDPFKRIAWKASARRGRLLVRETESEERAVVWLVVDASVELWAGQLGFAPLDRAVEEAASVAVHHLRRGDRVGLVVGASRLRTWMDPEEGMAQALAIAGALASTSSVIDVDRSEIDEVQVGRLVAEHARPLDPRGLSDVPSRKLDALTGRAEQLRVSAPFATRVPFAPTPRERALRHYLASFGIETPPRTEGERSQSEATLVRVLERLASERPRGNVVHVWSPAPSNATAIRAAVSLLRRRGVAVRWTLPQFEAGCHGAESEGASHEPRDESSTRLFSASPSTESIAGLESVVAEAVQMRAVAAVKKGERTLRALGVRVVAPQRLLRSASRVGRPLPSASIDASEASAPSARADQEAPESNA